MREAAHRHYRARLDALRSDELLLDPVSRAAARPDQRTTARWTRTYARFQPWTEPYALIVLGDTDGRPAIWQVEAFERRPDDSLGGHVSDVDQIGWIRVTPFTSDPALSTLSAVVSSAADVAVVRYRPLRRCTFRVARGDRISFAKVYPDDRGERIHDEARSLEEAAARGELRFRVAPSQRWDATHRTLWQQAVEGVSLPSALTTRTCSRLASQVGRALASLSRSSVRPRATFDAEAQRLRTRHYVDELRHAVPAATSVAEALLAHAVEMASQADTKPLRPVHGAPHPKQWLLTHDGTLGLVDFDRFSLGEPELDVATFAAAFDFDGDARTAERVAAQCQLAFESVAGRLDARRLAAYRLHKHLAKAYRAARAVHPEGGAKALRILAAAARRMGREAA